LSIDQEALLDDLARGADRHSVRRPLIEKAVDVGEKPRALRGVY
jgi:hypothetical protein